MREFLVDIHNHISVYENMGLPIPPYRATRQELKNAWPFIKPLILELKDNTHYDDIKFYMGVEIEVVTIG